MAQPNKALKLTAPSERERRSLAQCSTDREDPSGQALMLG